MGPTSSVTGDQLLTILGQDADTSDVQHSLTLLAHGMQPELDPDDDDVLVDWVTVNELGLEYGFEDAAYIRALDPDERRKGPLILSQLYFYSETPNTMPFPFALPFGLSFKDDRASVRQKLAEYDATRRSYIRDAWRLPKFDVTVAYEGKSGPLQSVFCHVPYAPWPTLPGEAERIASFTPDAFVRLFGLRWSNTDLRARLAPLGFGEALAEVRTEHVADLRLTHGLELTFAPGSEVTGADQRFPRPLTFAGLTFYSSRELDAREWIGELPFGLAFTDTQADLKSLMGEDPVEQSDDNLSGLAVWQFAPFTLSVLYSNLENRLLRVTMMAPSYWEAGGDSADSQ